MKGLFSTTCAAAMLAALAFSQSANATTITVTESQTLPTPFLSLPTSFTGTFSPVETLSIPNVQRSPWQGTPSDGSPYSVLNAGGGVNPSTALYNQDKGTTSVTILWGSPDSYNTVDIFSGQFETGLLLSLGGSGLTADTPGLGYDYVTFTASGGDIGSIELVNAGQAAFEYSNVPVGTGLSTTPLPGALPLFAGGLGLVGLLTRRRKQKGAANVAAA